MLGKKSLISNIIIDGKLMKNNIKSTNKSISWFQEQLTKMGYKTYQNILLATYSNDKIKIYRKNIDLEPVNCLE